MSRFGFVRFPPFGGRLLLALALTAFAAGSAAAQQPPPAAPRATPPAPGAGTAAAQQSPLAAPRATPPASAAGSAASRPIRLQLVAAPAPSGAARGSGVSVGRVIGELFGFSFAALPTALVGTGLVLGWEDCGAPGASSDCSAVNSVRGFFAVLAYAGAIAFVPFAVRVAGHLGGGNGGLGWTMLGYVAGLGFGGASTWPLWKQGGWLAGLGIGLFFTAQAAGAILGYELSSDDNHAPAATVVHARVVPTLAVARDGRGAVLGARGTF